MNTFLIAVLLVIGVMMAFALHRVYAGPTVFDRLVAVSLLTVNSVVMIVVLGYVFERPALFLDIALSYALLSFLLPIALGRYFERRHVGGERDEDERRLDEAAAGRQPRSAAPPTTQTRAHDDGSEDS